MKKILKKTKIIIACMLPLLSGCGIYQCIDAKIPRSPKPINEAFNIELKFQDQEMATQFFCEKYYDAQCSARGNSWRFREIGKSSGNDVSKFEFNDVELGDVTFPVPSCDSMLANRWSPTLKQFVPEINGENVWMRSSQGNAKTYENSGLEKGSKKSYKIEVTMKINGRQIKDCDVSCDNFR